MIAPHLTEAPGSSRAGWVAALASICIWTGFVLVSRAGGKGVLVVFVAMLLYPQGGAPSRAANRGPADGRGARPVRAGVCGKQRAQD
ncbi:MAG: hypothetical protein Q8O52_21245 [Sulfuritalea sp.]|nr:hypothetical protein [Sulfuritalea sp.]